MASKNIFQGKTVFITGIILLAVLIIAGIVIIGIGKSYQLGLSSFTLENKESEEITQIKKRTVKKIKIKKTGDTGCIEVTPDGIVKVDKDCNGDAEETSRPQNIQPVLNLFEIANYMDLEKYRQAEGAVIEVEIETETGIQTFWIPAGGGGASGQNIINIITQIQESIKPSPTPVAIIPTYAPGTTPNPTIVPSATGGIYPSIIPNASSKPLLPFTCEFKEINGTKKPFNVSGIICSTDPSPAP